MWIDIVFLILALFSLWSGWRHGFIISLFTTLAWILGIIGALKLSTAAAIMLRDHFSITSNYTPVIAFILIFLIIAFIVYLIGKALEKLITIIQLGFINRIFGALLRVIIFAFIFSLFIWLINQAGMISPEAKIQSKSYTLLQSIADHGINLFDQYLPAMKNIFTDIENFFQQIATKSTS